ncbi:MAG: oligoendopeptidase F [Spirochaetaceae bacterium]|nr:MAG: oligoendopeptidase F [Spirochaetaceae bacterium]
MSTTSTIPQRQDVPAGDQWDLSSLFAREEDWEQALREYQESLPRISEFEGTLGNSAENLAAWLEFSTELERKAERLGYYAHLRMSEDLGASAAQDRFARFMQAATKAEAAAGFQAPEIQAIADERMEEYLRHERVAPYEIALRKLLRLKPHVLSAAEERLLAMQQEANQTSSKVFGALTDVDMKFGTVHTPEGERDLSQSAYGSLMLHPQRDVRKEAHTKFYSEFEDHKNALAGLYAGSIQLDIYKAKVRNYPSAREAALFVDDVPVAVYDSLIDAVNEALPHLHRYYALRRRVLGLDKLHLYDTKVPLVSELTVRHSYEQAVAQVVGAVDPLGAEYVDPLREGLLGAWVDRYENKGKRSGAFSAGSYDGYPYILMNYKEDVLGDVFTLAHEAGHSMHSYFSVRANPFQHYDYTIFEAEVASTFNEQLLFDKMRREAKDEKLRLYLVNKQIDDILGTLIRQTMFAEFEKRTHEIVENGGAVTLDVFRAEYRKLLEKYFGPEVELLPNDDLEGLRVPHFYRAFYVYKYATGISAAIALSGRVLRGEPGALEAYQAFLRSGGSRYPIDSLRVAGVDMTKPEPVREALNLFAGLVGELESGLQ